MIDLTLYNTANRPEVVGKDLTQTAQMQGVFVKPFDVVTPVLMIRTNGATPTANYCKIEQLNRFYFINKITIQSNTSFTLNLDLDVLETYKNELLAANGLITQSENGDKYLSNRETIYNVLPQINRYEFSETTPFDKDGAIIMITLKG